MVDANIVVSAILFPKSIIAQMLKHLIDNHNLVLSKYNIYEIEDVFKEKFPQRLAELKEFMENTPYELFTLNDFDNTKYPKIIDIDDLPVLANAIESKVDLFITGDKDFDDVITEKLKIMKPRNYIDEFIL
jgi:putative PIN family toxin of toxin-antitoxin system